MIDLHIHSGQHISDISLLRAIHYFKNRNPAVVNPNAQFMPMASLCDHKYIQVNYDHFPVRIALRTESFQTSKN